MIKLDTWKTPHILKTLFDSQLQGLRSIEKNLDDLSNIIENSLIKLNAGGRLVFVGAGTSGRIAAQDASELYPTFSWPKEKTIVLVAGGLQALLEAREGAEDDRRQASNDVNKIALTKEDVVICVSASGKTPYTLEVLNFANEIGAYTIGVSGGRESPLFEKSKGKLFLDVGAEVIEGSTRLTAGTAQKVVLNMLTSTLMIKLNRVYGPYMVDLAITNSKLENRGIHIISQICHVNEQIAKEALLYCNKEVKLTCAYLKYGSIELAKKKLAEHNYNLRTCLEQE